MGGKSTKLSRWAAIALLLATGCGSALPKELAASELGCASSQVIIEPAREGLKFAAGCGRSLYYFASCGDGCQWKSGKNELTLEGAKALKCDARDISWRSVNTHMMSVEGCGKRAFFYRNSSATELSWQLQRIEELEFGARTERRSLSATQIYQRVVQSLVSIETPTGQATAFAVMDGKLLVTNLHAVAGQKELKLTSHQGDKLQFLGVLAFDRKWDLAVLQVDQALPALSLRATDAVTSGEKVFALGNPLGFEATISDGIVSGVREHMAGMRVLQITAAISPGSSGGPIVAEDGDVIGVATFVVRGGENLGFAMPNRYIRELLTAKPGLSREAFATATAADDQSGKNLFQSGLYAHCPTADLTSVTKVLGSAVSALEPLLAQGSYGPGLYVFRGATDELSRQLSGKCPAPREQLRHAERTTENLPSERVRLLVLKDLLDAMLAEAKQQTSANSKE